jgi:hypothetical protein
VVVVLTGVKASAFTLYVATNMSVCAIIFMPWAKPRETISGLLGRWRDTETGWKQRFAARACPVVDFLYWWDKDHCREVFRVEHEARLVLYP